MYCWVLIVLILRVQLKGFESLESSFNKDENRVDFGVRDHPIKLGQIGTLRDDPLLLGVSVAAFLSTFTMKLRPEDLSQIYNIS